VCARPCVCVCSDSVVETNASVFQVITMRHTDIFRYCLLCSTSGLENREHGREDPSRWPRDTLYPQNLALTSTTSDGRSAGIVHVKYSLAE
jgi:hypothetical protein